MDFRGWLRVLILSSIVLVSGCTNTDTSNSGVPTTVEDIPKQTNLFPENYETVTVGEETHLSYAGDKIYLLKELNSSSNKLKLEYSEGEFEIPVTSTEAEIDGKLAWEDDGKIYVNGKEVVEGQLPFEVEDNLGFVNSTPEGDKISVYNSSLPRFEQNKGLSINQISYSDGFFYSTSGYAGGESALFRNGEKLIQENYTGEFFRTSNGKAYISTSEPVWERNSTSEPFEEYKHYRITRPGVELHDIGSKGPVYVIEFTKFGSRTAFTYQEVWRNNKMLERFNWNDDISLWKAVQTDSGLAYLVREIIETEEGEREGGDYYIYMNQTYYGPYKNLEHKKFGEVKGSLVYQATPKNQEKTFLVSRDLKDWVY